MRIFWGRVGRSSVHCLFFGATMRVDCGQDADATNYDGCVSYGGAGHYSHGHSTTRDDSLKPVHICSPLFASLAILSSCRVCPFPHQSSFFFSFHFGVQ